MSKEGESTGLRVSDEDVIDKDKNNQQQKSLKRRVQAKKKEDTGAVRHERKRRKKELTPEREQSSVPVVDAPSTKTEPVIVPSSPPAPATPPSPTVPPKDEKALVPMTLDSDGETPDNRNLFILCQTHSSPKAGGRKTSYFIAKGKEKEDILNYVIVNKKGPVGGVDKRTHGMLKKRYECMAINRLALDKEVVFNVVDNMKFFDPSLSMPISKYSNGGAPESPSKTYFCDLTSLIFPGSAAVVFKAEDVDDALHSLIEFIVVYYKSKKYSSTKIDKDYLSKKITEITSLVDKVHETHGGVPDVHLFPITIA